jgi:hypothetical protein
MWAGDNLGFTQVDDAECNTPCDADPSEMCGGPWRNGIWRPQSLLDPAATGTPVPEN